MLKINRTSVDGVNLWVKKDEDTGFLTSGNKIRKLEFLLADAIDKGCDCVITAGRYARLYKPDQT